jgi:hypothetical protein
MTQVSWIIFDRDTRAPRKSFKTEQKARATCETINGKANREMTYVRRIEVTV